jgi:hypothetical protein
MPGFFHPCGGPSNFIISSIQFKEPIMQGIKFCHSFDRWAVKLYTGQHHSEPGAPKRQSCPQLTPAEVIPLFRNTPFSLGITLHLKKFTKIEILCLGGTPYRFCDSLEVFRGRRRLYGRWRLRDHWLHQNKGPCKAEPRAHPILVEPVAKCCSSA